MEAICGLMLMGPVLELLISTNLLAIIVIYTNCFLLFWFWNSFLPICLFLLLLGIGWSTTLFIQQIQFRPSSLLKQFWKTEQKFPAHGTAALETSSPRFQLVMLPSLLETSTLSWLSVIKSALFFPERGQSDSCFLLLFVTSFADKGKKYSCSGHQSWTWVPQIPPV